LTFSLLVAVLPTNTNLSDIYFYNGYYTENIPLFLSPKRNQDLLPLIEQYYQHTNSSYVNDSSISAIKKNIENMFGIPLDNNTVGIQFKTLGFYGSSGSCIFKYFVDLQDPQVHYSWFVLTLNFLCFLVIAASYLSVHILSQKSASKVGMKQRFGPLQRKITLIILTDFLCWVPFITICMLHTTGAINATPLYPIFSVIVLPINSLINPLLYDSFFMTVPRMVYNRVRNMRARLVRWSQSNNLHDVYALSSSSRHTDEQSKVSQNVTNVTNAAM